MESCEEETLLAHQQFISDRLPRGKVFGLSLLLRHSLGSSLGSLVEIFRSILHHPNGAEGRAAAPSLQSGASRYRCRMTPHRRRIPFLDGVRTGARGRVTRGTPRPACLHTPSACPRPTFSRAPSMLSVGSSRGPLAATALSPKRPKPVARDSSS
jgi:hypothetical protein